MDEENDDQWLYGEDTATDKSAPTESVDETPANETSVEEDEPVRSFMIQLIQY